MHFRSSLRTRRRICCATLLAWVFAIASGAANGCVLTAHQPGIPNSALVGQADSATDDDALAPAPSANHDAAHPSHEDHEDSHAGCHKFCNDEGATVTKHASADSPNFSHLLIDTGIAMPARPTSAALAQRVAERPWANGPPLVIRFLRLTL